MAKEVARSAEALEVRDVRFGYAKRREVLHSVSAAMPSGQLTAIVGPNGCGKTTLVKCIVRVNRVWSGSVVLRGAEANAAGASDERNGEQHAGSREAIGVGSREAGSGQGAGEKDLLACPLPELARVVGYVPQRASAELAGSVVDYLLLGRRQFLAWRLDEADLAAVRSVLERLGIAHLANASFAELSGGERQKVLVARALLQQPRALLLDEPTSSLDIRNQREMLELAASLAHDEGKVVVCVLHDLSAALRYADHVVLMDAGSVVAAGRPRDVLTPQAIERVYGTQVRISPDGYVNPFA